MPSLETTPLFTYGSLKGEGIMENTGVQATYLGRFLVRRLVVGMGDLYPCADITSSYEDSVLGEGYALDDYTNAMDAIDEYEGVEEGYYKRKIVFSNPENNCDLFVPMWVYIRGEKLTIPTTNSQTRQDI